jgi:hypothetical protein
MSESAKNYHTVEACRVGTSHNLISVLNLGASGRGARPSTLPAKFFAVIGFANSVLLRQIEA